MTLLVNEYGLTALAYDPGVGNSGTAPAFGTNAVIDASGEKVAMVGCVWHPTVKTGTINIRKVHFRCGAVSINAASTVRVSLQTVSDTAGPPYQPDGTQDQTADIAGSAMVANGWNITGNLSADRAVDLSADTLTDSNSRWVSVVIEFQSFTAADSVVVSAVDAPTSGLGLGGGMLLNTGTYALLATRISIVALECDDGSFAFLRSSAPWSAFNSVSVTSNGAIRRAGVKFQVPTRRTLDSAAIMVRVPSGSNGRLALYTGNNATEQVSIDIDRNAVSAFGADRLLEVMFPPVTLEPATDYRFAFIGTSATAATVYYGDVNAAGLMDGLIFGQQAQWTQYDGSSWTDTATRRPHFGLGFSAFQAQGGGLRSAGMGGLAS